MLTSPLQREQYFHLPSGTDLHDYLASRKSPSGIICLVLKLRARFRQKYCRSIQILTKKALEKQKGCPSLSFCSSAHETWKKNDSVSIQRAFHFQQEPDSQNCSSSIAAVVTGEFVWLSGHGTTRGKKNKQS